LVERRCPM